MEDKNLLHQISLLNPKLKSKDRDSVNINNGEDVSSSLSQINYNQLPFNNSLNSSLNNNNNNMFENQDENEVLNLWSSTNIFFDSMENSELSKC